VGHTLVVVAIKYQGVVVVLRCSKGEGDQLKMEENEENR
jgi:hypothetical protein